MKALKAPLIILLAALILQSCTTMMDPDAAVLKTSLKKLNTRAKVRLVSKKDMTVFVRYRNSSKSVFDIKEELENKIRKTGYRLVDDLDQAQFILIADLRHVGQKSSDTYGHSIFGALIGVIAGVIIGESIGGGSTEGHVIGGAIGGILGGLGGKAIDNRNRIVTVDMVVDISLGERIQGGVTTSRKTSSDSGLNQGANSKTSGSVEGGRTSTSYSEKTEFSQKQDFVYHENRLIATATKLKLTYNEAQDALAGEISRAIAASLP